MNLQEQYPDFFNEEGTYINGSIENKIERIKDEMRINDVEVLRWLSGRPSSKYTSQQFIINLQNELEQEINQLEGVLYQNEILI